MASHGEYAMLLAAANAALVRSLDDGDAHGYITGLWLEQSPLLHYQHAHEHVDRIFIEGDDTSEHLDHAICRLIMLKIARDKPYERGH